MKDAKGHGSNKRGAHASGTNQIGRMDERTISGLEFVAHAEKGGWVAKVKSTGHTLEQSYRTRPAMWDDLERIARLIGPERFTRDLKG